MASECTFDWALARLCDIRAAIRCDAGAMDTAMYALSYDRFDERSDEIFAYARENGRWKVYFRSDKQFNRRIQALFIGVDPRLYVAVRKIRLRLRGRKVKRG